MSLGGASLGGASLGGASESGSLLGAGLGGPASDRRHYTEYRIEPGEQVTVVGFARPYGEIDPARPDAIAATDLEAIDDPVVARDVAEARASGHLARSAREAWGNAAIPGFGIGRPVEKPVLDPGVKPPEAPDPALARRAKEIFDVPPETLVVTTDPSRPLTVYAGSPVAATDFDHAAYLRGLAGGALAIASILALALVAKGGI